jgi:hypothetical protein
MTSGPVRDLSGGRCDVLFCAPAMPIVAGQEMPGLCRMENGRVGSLEEDRETSDPSQ